MRRQSPGTTHSLCSICLNTPSSCARLVRAPLRACVRASKRRVLASVVGLAACGAALSRAPASFLVRIQDTTKRARLLPVRTGMLALTALTMYIVPMYYVPMYLVRCTCTSRSPCKGGSRLYRHIVLLQYKYIVHNSTMYIVHVLCTRASS